MAYWAGVRLPSPNERDVKRCKRRKGAAANGQTGSEREKRECAMS